MKVIISFGAVSWWNGEAIPRNKWTDCLIEVWKWSLFNEKTHDESRHFLFLLLVDSRRLSCLSYSTLSTILNWVALVASPYPLPLAHLIVFGCKSIIRHNHGWCPGKIFFSFFKCWPCLEDYFLLSRSTLDNLWLLTQFKCDLHIFMCLLVIFKQMW